uniref:Uncharacterized protein n=1 Tax=Glossina morsitans morsitans TaxID=37546 RepID=A0A1B0GFX4_GLOMM
MGIIKKKKIVIFFFCKTYRNLMKFKIYANLCCIIKLKRFCLIVSQMHSELKKFSRGTWQATMFSVIISDFCKEMKDTKSIVYDVWAKHIISENVRCPAKGVRTFDYRKYDQEPFSLSVDFNVSGVNMEGRYKIISIFRAYDEKNREKPNAVCVEAPGDIIKV